MGKPIITSDIPGCRETVEDGVNGFLVPPQNTTALIKAMQRYIDLSKEEKLTFSKAGRRIAEELFDVRKVAERYEQILAEVFADK